MQVCKYASMQVCKYASMQTSRDACMKSSSTVTFNIYPQIINICMLPVICYFLYVTCYLNLFIWNLLKLAKTCFLSLLLYVSYFFSSTNTLLYQYPNKEGWFWNIFTVSSVILKKRCYGVKVQRWKTLLPSTPKLNWFNWQKLVLISLLLGQCLIPQPDQVPFLSKVFKIWQV